MSEEGLREKILSIIMYHTGGETTKVDSILQTVYEHLIERMPKELIPFFSIKLLEKPLLYDQSEYFEVFGRIEENKKIRIMLAKELKGEK